MAKPTKSKAKATAKPSAKRGAVRAKPKPKPPAKPLKAKARPPKPASKTGAKVKAKAVAPVARVKSTKAAIKLPEPEPKPKPKPKPKKPLFDKKSLREIRKNLLAMRGEFQKELEEIEAAAFNVSQSEMSGEVGYDEDYADAGSFTFERERDLSIANNIQDLLDKIDRSLEKVDDGTYGYCEVCGNPIESARLKALPHALLCVKDKTLEERR